MTTIQTIAATTECNDVIPEQMNTELTILSIIRYSSTAW